MSGILASLVGFIIMWWLSCRGREGGIQYLVGILGMIVLGSLFIIHIFRAIF